MQKNPLRQHLKKSISRVIFPTSLDYLAHIKSQHRFVPLWYRTIPLRGPIWQVIFGVLEGADKTPIMQDVRSTRGSGCGNDSDLER
jgi:hypothetical protein